MNALTRAVLDADGYELSLRAAQADATGDPGEPAGRAIPLSPEELALLERARTTNARQLLDLSRECAKRGDVAGALLFLGSTLHELLNRIEDAEARRCT